MQQQQQFIKAKQYLFDPATALDKALQLPPILDKKMPISSTKPQSKKLSRDLQQPKLPSIPPLTALTATPNQQHQYLGRASLTPPKQRPSKEKKSLEIQTEPFLEPLPFNLETSQISTQTDDSLPRPPSPLFVPKSSGVDAETQIEEGDLFDFDREVEPLLEIMVGQCIEHSWTECEQESEMGKIAERKAYFQRRRAAERVEILRLEEAEKRRQNEIEQRLQEQAQKMKQRMESDQLRMLRTLSTNLVSATIKTAFEVLDNRGYFQQKLEKEMQKEFDLFIWPELQKHLENKAEADTIVDGIIAAALLLPLSF